jgi:protein tyrosine phosphatase (PTP) superfamily phosphohydrolase (DUF442 family)
LTWNEFVLTLLKLIPPGPSFVPSAAARYTSKPIAGSPQFTVTDEAVRVAPNGVRAWVAVPPGAEAGTQPKPAALQAEMKFEAFGAMLWPVASNSVSCVQARRSAGTMPPSPIT